MNKTNIAWTDYTWNPITGCTAGSAGCKNCYAKAVHERFYDTPFSEIVFHEDRLTEPFKVKKPSKIFIGSMTDLFQDGVDFKYINEIIVQVSKNPQHTFQILTKRPDRMKRYFDGWEDGSGGKYHFPNLWLGVTAENQEQADKRIPILLDTPAAKRFVSIEPMIGEIDLTRIMKDNKLQNGVGPLGINSLLGSTFLGTSIPALNWIIVGGESGAKSKTREMKSEWVRKLYLQCVESRTPFFFKQWGSHKPKYHSKFEEVKEFPS